MKKVINKLLSDEFIKNNLIFFIGTLCISFFNYLYYPVLGRILSVEYYGEVQALISLYMQLAIFLTVFGYITINIMNNHSKEEEKLTIITELERLAFFLSAIACILILVFSNEAKQILKFNSIYPFILLGPLLLITIPFTFRNYFLQGQKKLKEVSIAGIIYSLAKLILAVFLIIAGFKSLGAMFGYIIGIGLALVYVYSKTKHQLLVSRPQIPVLLYGKSHEKEKQLIKGQLFLGTFIFVLLISVTLLYTFDTVIVRKYFSPVEAGMFSGVSTIARIIYFASSSIAGVLIASVSLKTKSEENRKLLINSTYLVTFIGISGVIAFTLFPKFIIDILLGKRYDEFASLLPYLSVSMVLASLTNLIFTYQIALRRYFALIPAILGIASLFLLSNINHATLKDIVFNFIIANSLALLAAIIQTLIEENNAKKTFNRHTSS